MHLSSRTFEMIHRHRLSVRLTLAFRLGQTLDICQLWRQPAKERKKKQRSLVLASQSL